MILVQKHEDYITQKYDTGVFVTHWPFSIKSFYMKRNRENPDYCDCFDLLLPYGIGEIIGGSQREDDYHTLIENMELKNVRKK